MRHRGFTLIELLVTIAVIVIMATIAVPGFQNMMATNRLNSDYNEILSGLYLARSEAIKRRQEVTFTLDDNSSPWSYEVSLASGGDALRARSGASGSVTVSGDQMSFTFNRLGRLESPECAGSCTLTIGHSAVDDKSIHINPFGRIGRGGS